MANRKTSLSRSIIRRPARSVLAPDTVDGPSGPPVMLRFAKIRYANPPAIKLPAKAWRKPGHTWNSLEIVIPREIAEIAGFEAGMTLCMEVYGDSRVRMFPAGDVMSRDEEAI